MNKCESKMQQAQSLHLCILLASAITWSCLFPICPGTAEEAPECFPEGHQILHNAYRSINFDSLELQEEAIQDMVCDHSLPQGWYRFMIENKPAEMPTKCIEMNKCGTQAPIWLSLQSDSLPRPGERKALTACATWEFFSRSAKDCCLFRIPISVRHCGEFFVYFLQPTQGCMGYCAEVVEESRFNSFYPKRTELEDIVQGQFQIPPLHPVVTPELLGSDVFLKCTFSRPTSDWTVAYSVTWSRLSTSSVKEQLHHDTTVQTFSYVEMDGVNFRLGDTVFCIVTAFKWDSPDHYSLSEESNGFYAGIKFVPESLQIAEDGREHILVILSTIPISCLGQDDNCKITLQLNTQVSDKMLQRTPDLALSTCHVDLEYVPCKEGNCARASLAVRAVTDFVEDGNVTTYIVAKPVNPSKPLWNNYKPMNVKVTVQDLPTGYCYSFTDPHIITFDGRHYDNDLVGTFVLYKSLSRLFEVQVRQWNLHASIACICGVVAQEDSDIVVLDMCNRQFLETKPQLIIKNIKTSSQQNVRIMKSYGGKKLTILFHSGAFVRADLSDWGMSLTVRAPSIDFNRTRGLCGTFDRKSQNDFHSADGRALLFPQNSTTEENFIKTWRIAPGMSLFDKTPRLSERQKAQYFCLCQKMPESYFQPLNTLRIFQNPPPQSLDCYDDNVYYTSVIPYLDVTSDHVIQLKMNSSLLDDGQSVSVSNHWEDLQGEKKQGSEKYLSVSSFQSLRQTDSESFTYFFPEDYLEGKWPEVQTTWPTPSGQTLAKVLANCQMFLENSAIGSVCKELLGTYLDMAIEMCISDVQIKDNNTWRESLIPFLENVCESRVLVENMLEYFHSVYELPAILREIVRVLRCPSLCNGHGKCTAWGCQCFEGYSSHDCTIVKKSREIKITSCRRRRLTGTKGSFSGPPKVKMVFENATDPVAVVELLEKNVTKIQLSELIPSDEDFLAFYEASTRYFLFPEPKLTPSYPGVDRELLMNIHPSFPGIAPKIEFSTRTTITELSLGFRRWNSDHNKVRLRRVASTSSRRRSISPVQSRATRIRSCRSVTKSLQPHSRSPSPRRRLRELCRDNHQQLSSPNLRAVKFKTEMDHRPPFVVRHVNSSKTFSEEALPPYQKASKDVILSRNPHKYQLKRALSYDSWKTACPAAKVVREPSEEYSSDCESPAHESRESAIHDDSPPAFSYRSCWSPGPSRRWESPQHRICSGLNSSWEEINERVRNLLTSSEAKQRLSIGAADFEIDDVLERRSISLRSSPQCDSTEQSHSL